ncbi:hypothetical protein [Streptomyces marincola]|uniref:DUF3558 domain-containing protein n=1 Tax=Streptomyces marincola TaxID=2878388 RepID=A0A1W7CX25_9ACTN|nr:hypothetical protein [Streptomyces marincola]ARQ69364.1 hypothetical protein CAG99_11200 [Streptomyces marincola]
MQRTMAARWAGLILTAVCGLTACSGNGGGQDTTGAGPPGGSAGSAQPGRYSGLPEPCGAVGADILRELLPGAEAEVYAGEPMVTYDTGRRVGCEWNSTAETATQRLTVDYQRVVSYDPDVSDDDQAALDFDERASEAGIPSAVPPPTDPLAPRPLDGIGQAAFIDDRQTASEPGERREITLAFRNANVIVTVTYAVSTTLPEPPLDSEQLQQRTRDVAQRLAQGLDG